MRYFILRTVSWSFGLKYLRIHEYIPDQTMYLNQARILQLQKCISNLVPSKGNSNFREGPGTLFMEVITEKMQ